MDMGGGAVVVVDDDIDHLALMSHWLEAAGYDVDPVDTEGVVGNTGQEGRVGTPGERHHHPPQVLQRPAKGVEARPGHIGGGCHGQRRPTRARTVSRSSTTPK